MTADDEQLSDAELTALERRGVRRLLRSDGRRRWLWGGVRIWAKWLLQLPPALVTAWLALQQIFGSGSPPR